MQAILDGTHIGTWEWNVQTGETRFNERWAEIAGYTLAELHPVNIETWQRLAHPDDLVASAEQLQLHFDGKQPYYDIRCRMKHKEGHWVWVHDRGQVMSRTPDGKPLMMFGTHSDVTEEIEAQRALQEQKELLRVIVDNIPINVYVKNQQGRKIMANRAERLFMGLSPDADDIALHDCDFLPAHLAAKSGQEDRRVLSTGESLLAQEHDSQGPDGQSQWQLVSKIPLRNSEGQIDRLLGITVDISERKKTELALEAKEERLRALFELSPVGIALSDYDTGMFLEVNDALLASVGYSRETLLGMTYRDITPDEYASMDQETRNSLDQTGRYGPIEKEYINAWGDRYPVQLSGLLVEERSGQRLIWSIIEDITERQRNERLKREFVSTVSHELRTPLTSISGALGLVRGGVFGQLPTDALDMVAMAHDSAQQLTVLINDLLDMDKLVAGKMRMQLRPLSLDTILAKAVRENQPYADAFDVTLHLVTLDTQIGVMADEHRMMQILNNLLSNAAKFTQEGTRVELGIEPIGNHARIWVRDQGPGIKEDFADQIFEPFSQVDGSDSRRRGGTGLGLAICKQLVELMHGSIGYSSVVGEGATFYVELPLAR